MQYRTWSVNSRVNTEQGAVTLCCDLLRQWDTGDIPGFVRKGRNVNKLTGKTIKITKKKGGVCEIKVVHVGAAQLPVTRMCITYLRSVATPLLTVAVHSDTRNLQQHLKIHTAAGDHRYVMSFLAWLWRQTSDGKVKMWLGGCHTSYFDCVHETKRSISGYPTWRLRPKCNTSVLPEEFASR